MIWNSVFLMTLIDCLIIFAVLYSIAIFYKHYRAAQQLGLTVSVNFILSGLALIGLFYLIDLSTMHIYPFFTSQTFAMASMTNLHLNWSWIGILISVGAIAIGLSYLVQVLIPKTSRTLENLRFTENSLKEELAARQRAETALRESHESLERQAKERTAETVWVESRTRPLRDDAGQFQGFIGVTRDITERKRVAEALRESEERYRKLMEESPVGIEVFSPNGTLLNVNKTWEKMWGIAAEDVVGKYNPLDNEWFRKTGIMPLIEQAFAGEHVRLYDIEFDPAQFNLPGRKRWVQGYAYHVKNEAGKIKNVVLLSEDITERKQAEEALRKSEERYRAIVEDQTELICRAWPEGTFGFVNEAYCRYYGKQREELIGSRLEPSPVFDEDRDLLEKYYAALGPEKPLGTIEHRVILLNGEVRWQQWADRVLLDEQGRIIEYQSVGRDITERKQAEEALARRAREMEALYETWLEINRHLDISILLQAIVQRAAELLGTQMGGLFLMQPDGETLELVVGHNQPDEYIGSRLRLGEGLTGRIAQAGEPLQIANYRDWEGRVSSVGGDTLIGRILGVSLKQRDQVIGVLNVFDEEEGGFGEDEVRLLGLFAAQAVIAIENSRLIEQTHLGRERLKILHEIDQAILAAQSSEEIAEAALGHIRRLVPCKRASVVLYNFKAQEAALLAVHLNGDTRLQKGQHYALEASENITHMQQGRPYIVEDIQTLAKPSNTVQQLLAEGIRSYISMPLIFRNELIGSLSLGVTKPGPFEQAHVEITHQIADQLAIAIQQAQLRAAETQRRREAETLRDATVALTSALELDQVLDAILTHLEAVVPYDSAGVFLHENGHLHAVAGRGFPDLEQVKGQRYPLDDDVFFIEIQRTARPFILADAQAEPRFVHWADTGYIRGWMGVPLIVSGKVIGYLTLDNRQAAAYGEAEAALAQALASQAAIAIEKAQLFEAEQRQREIAETLGKVARAVNSSLDLTAVLNRVLLELEKVIKYDSASIRFLEQDTLRLAAGRRFGDKGIDMAPSISLTELPLGQKVINQREPISISDTKQEPLFNPNIHGDSSIRCLISIPLISREDVIGLLTVSSWTPHRYSAQDADVAFQFAQQATIAIENARLYTETEQRAEHLAVLRELDQAITASLHVDDVYQAFAQQTLRLLPYDHMSIGLLEGDNMHAAYTTGKELVVPTGTRQSIKTVGMMSLAIKQGQPILSGNIAVDTRFVAYEQAIASGLKSAMIIPLHVKGQIIGAWNLARQQVEGYTDDDLATAQSMADQLAIAVENARLFDQAQHYAKVLEQRVADRTRELSALYDVTAVASESLDLQSALERSLEQVLAAMRTNMGIIRLLDEDGETLRLVAQQGLPPESVAMLEAVSSSSGLVGQVIEQGEPLIVPDITTDPRAARASLVAPQTAYVGVPIRARGRVLGTLSILKDKDQPQFSMEEITLLTSIADHVGVVVESARLRQLVSQTAVLEERSRLARDLHDSVTQLLYSLNLFAAVGRESHQIGDIDQVDNSLKEIGEIAQQALKEMRLLVYELRPATLEQEGLVGALQHRLDAVEGRVGVKTRLLLDEVIELEEHLEEVLYRITQEALNNALKHAAATSVTVRLAIKGKRVVTLEVADNGLGFDPDRLNGGGLGLVSMRERAEGLGGTLTINSVPGEGTTVKVRVKNKATRKSRSTL